MGDTNNTYYGYETLLSYMNCFDPNDKSKIASFQSSKNIKLILTLPTFATCNTEDGKTTDAYYLTPNSQIMQAFVNGVKSIQAEGLQGTIPESIANFSIENNVVYLDDVKPCPVGSDTMPNEAPMDIIASAMIGTGCDVEFWASKYSLLGLLSQIQTKAEAKDSDEMWIFSLSWGTYGICDFIDRQETRFQIDVGQTCGKVTSGCPSGDTAPCNLTNAEYIGACEEILENLTTNYNCIFFVSSGDDGPTSLELFNTLPYFVDYPTCSQHVISVGGVNYKAQAPSNQATNKTPSYALTQKISPNAIGIATPVTSDSRANNTPEMTVGGDYDASGGTLMKTGGGFTGYTDSTNTTNDTLQIKARSSQIPFVNTYMDSSTMPKGYNNTQTWNKANPQRGIPDISGCMANGLAIGWDQSDNTKFNWLNADGTSFSSPLIAGFFALLLSYADLPANTQLIDFIYANPDCFDKPQTVSTNSFSDNQGNLVNGYTSTTTQGTWDPCVGIGVPNFLELYNKLTS